MILEFEKSFDASNYAIGKALFQDGKSIAFESKKLSKVDLGQFMKRS